MSHYTMLTPLGALVAELDLLLAEESGEAFRLLTREGLPEDIGDGLAEKVGNSDDIAIVIGVIDIDRVLLWEGLRAIRGGSFRLLFDDSLDDTLPAGDCARVTETDPGALRIAALARLNILSVRLRDIPAAGVCVPEPKPAGVCVPEFG
jgi:hypothetical protein